jgi:cytoskeletal protein CcmA (bactofilin family)
MARQQINIGTSANDGTGDPLRTAFDKINDNVSEIYTNLGGDSLSNLGHTGNTLQSLDTNGNIVLSPNGTGTVELPAISFNDNNITGSRSNEDLNISASGTGNVNVASALTTIGQTVTGNITVTGNETITGNVTVTGDETITGNVTVTGATDVDNIKLDGNTISTTNTNGDLILNPNGTGQVVLNQIKSDDSSAIQINDSLNVSGTLSVNSIDTNLLVSTDSSAIQITESVNVSGSITASDINGTVRTDKIQSETSNADIQVDTQGTGLVDFRTETQETVGAVGAASKLPLDSANEVRPVGYLKIKVGGTEYVVPYFNAS